MVLDKLKLSEIGERKIVSELLSNLRPTDLLLDGLGHDSGFIQLELKDDEILVVNTDRSGENLAYKLGLAGPEVVGQLAVSHSVSDIVAAGGVPQFLTVSLMLPEDKTLDYAKKLMSGVQTAAELYDIVIASGDTKKNPKVVLVITVVGKGKKSRRLSRSGAKVGDFLVVTGYLGTMFSAALAYKLEQKIPAHLENTFRNSLVYQQPPVNLGLELSSAEIANACTDISDGLPSAVYDICSSSGVGASINLASVPLDYDVENFAKSCLGINRTSLVQRMAIGNFFMQFLGKARQH